MSTPRTHLVIPDTQVKPGVPLDHLYWAAEYIMDRKPDVLVHLGDHADLPSLSSYDVGKMAHEGKRYIQDIDAANNGFDILNSAMNDFNEAKRKYRKGYYRPEKHFLLGNHEHRITRAIENDAKLEGAIGLEDLNYEDHGWEVHPFLKPVELDGVHYAHFWSNPMTGKPIGGVASTRLKTIGHSFTMGHQQTLDYSTRFLANGDQHCGLIAGSFYLHDEDYKGWQGNAHWRGLIVCHEVENGAYDPMFVSMSYLCRKYEGISLEKFRARKF